MQDFRKGGPGISENLRLVKTRMKIFQPKTKFAYLPKLGYRPKKRSSFKFSPVFGPKSGEDQKKWSSLKFSPVFGPPKSLRPPFLCSSYKEGAMPEFCILFYANYTILATQSGGHCSFPPRKNAPVFFPF